MNGISDPALHAALTRRIESLAPAQRRLLALRLAHTAPPRRAAPTRLVACVTSRGPARLNSDALREFARTRLPEHMVPHTVVVCDELPRMASGKIDRRALMALADRSSEAGTGETVAPRDETESTLARIWADVLGLDEVGVHDDFFEVGGDSLLSIRILARAHDAGLTIAPEAFFANPTVAGQARAARANPHVPATPTPNGGPIALTPIQHWFFERIPIERQHWNQSLLALLERDLDRTTLEGAVRQILSRHDALRLRFVTTETGWQQTVADAAEVPFAEVDLRDVDADRLDAALEEVAAGLNREIDIERGPLLRAALVRTRADTPDRLALSVHHLAIDAISWTLLLEDLERACLQYIDGVPAAPPASAVSFRAWAGRLAQYAQSDTIRAQLPFWTAAVSAGGVDIPCELATDPGVNRVDSAEELICALDPGGTERIAELAREWHASIHELLVWALAEALSGWLGRRSLTFDVEGHGREPLFDDVDVSRSIGWFTTVYPVHLELPDDGAAGERFAAVKAQLRAIPANGIGYGLLRELCADRDAVAALRAAPPAHVLFNYMGRVSRPLRGGQLFHVEHENPGAPRNGRGLRAYIIEINARVVDGALQVRWSYSRALHRRKTIAALAECFAQALDPLLDGAKPPAPAPTPSDFPLAGLDQAELEALSRQLDAIDGDDGDDGDGA